MYGGAVTFLPVVPGPPGAGLALFAVGAGSGQGVIGSIHQLIVPARIDAMRVKRTSPTVLHVEVDVLPQRLLRASMKLTMVAGEKSFETELTKLKLGDPLTVNWDAPDPNGTVKTVTATLLRPGPLGLVTIPISNASVEVK